jgi:hypothetical protein
MSLHCCAGDDEIAVEEIVMNGEVMYGGGGILDPSQLCSIQITSQYEISRARNATRPEDVDAVFFLFYFFPLSYLPLFFLQSLLYFSSLCVN